MNEDTIKGKWKQASGKAKWGKLTDDDVTQASGNREHLAGKLQEAYGITKEKANEQIDEFQRSL